MDDSTPLQGSEQELTTAQKHELRRIAHQAAANLNERQLYFLGYLLIEMAIDLDPNLDWGDDK